MGNFFLIKSKSADGVFIWGIYKMGVILTKFIASYPLHSFNSQAVYIYIYLYREEKTHVSIILTRGD